MNTIYHNFLNLNINLNVIDHLFIFDKYIFIEDINFNHYLFNFIVNKIIYLEYFNYSTFNLFNFMAYFFNDYVF